MITIKPLLDMLDHEQNGAKADMLIINIGAETVDNEPIKQVFEIPEALKVPTQYLEVVECAVCEDGIARFVTWNKPMDLEITDGTAITRDSLENMKEYEKLLVMTLFYHGYVQSMYKRLDTDGDGQWDTLVRWDNNSDTYQIVEPD